MITFRFIHTADIHLDSPLKGLAGQVGNAAERVRSATRVALVQLIDFAIEEKVDFIVIAGDLYDGVWRDFKTGLFFVEQMGRLKEVDIPVYLIYGNHDAESQVTKRLGLPDNVHVFGSNKPETFEVDGLTVAIHGQSFRQREVTDNLVPDYPAPTTGAFNIGMLHTALGGSEIHGNYAPCSLDDLVNKGYDYWALGHVHQFKTLHERPHIVFSGNLQGRHVREIGAKGACLVTVEDGEVTSLVPVHCDAVRWAVLNVSVEQAESVGRVLENMRNALESAITNEADGRLLACRIILTGKTGVHDQILTSTEQLLAEVRAQALGLGDEAAWVEKVIIDTESPIDPETLAQREDAIGEMQQMMLDSVKDDELLTEIRREIGELVSSLPHELKVDMEDELLKSAVGEDYASIIKGVTPYLSARIAGLEMES